MRRHSAIILKSGQPERLLIELSHHKQKYNWDCGISCVLMVLSKKERQQFLQNFNEICREEGFHSSTWTIDLCYLLNRFNIKHVLYTITIGVHPGYRGHSFYNSVYSKDEARIKLRFKEAETNGIKVRNASLRYSKIINHLVNGPVIVLTNAKMLTCDVCKLNKIASELRKCIPWPTTYQGHYIVLCGYQSHNNKVFYRNPSLTDRVCVMSLDSLDEARKCYGTDEDIIFIYK